MTDESTYYVPAENGMLSVSKEAGSDVTATVGTFTGRNGMKVDSAEAIVSLVEDDVEKAVGDISYSTTITVGIVTEQ